MFPNTTIGPENTTAWMHTPTDIGEATRAEHTLPDGDDYPHTTERGVSCGCFPRVTVVREPDGLVARLAHCGPTERP